MRPQLRIFSFLKIRYSRSQHFHSLLEWERGKHNKTCDFQNFSFVQLKKPGMAPSYNPYFDRRVSFRRGYNFIAMDAFSILIASSVLGLEVIPYCVLARKPSLK